MPIRPVTARAWSRRWHSPGSRSTTLVLTWHPFRDDEVLDVPETEPFVIRALLAARYVTFAAVVLLFVALAWSGKRVSYEQSINSFFAEDDPYMAVYQQAAQTFGDDNFVFLVYDDPGTADARRAWTGFPSWPPRSGRIASPAVQRVESLDAMPLLWSIDDALLALDRLPAMARNLALERGQAGDQERRPEDQRDDGRRGRPSRRGGPGGPGRAQGSPDAASAVPGHADRRDRHDDGRGGPAAKDASAQRDRDGGRAAADRPTSSPRGTSSAGRRSSARPCSWPTASRRSRSTAAAWPSSA